MNLSNYSYTHSGGIAQWDKALPIGNGRIGVLLYGTDTIRLSIDRVDLWDTRPAPPVKEKNFNYDYLKKLVNSGSDADWKEYTRMFDTISEDTAYPSKITAGRLELSFDSPFTPNFSLDLENGLAKIYDENGNQRITGFADAVSFVGVFRIKGDYSLNIHIPKYISAKETTEKVDPSICSPRAMEYPKADIVKENCFTYYRQKTHTDFEYGIVVFEKDCGEWREIYCTITTNNDGENDLESAKNALLDAADIGYDTLFAAHTAWWQSFWSKSEIRIGDPLVEKVYYQSQYLFGSCSRKGFYPMPLQGVWTADDDVLPPWKGDYHYDLNVQQSYQPYLKANRLPEGEVLLDYLWDMRDKFREFTRNFFQVDGMLLPGTATIDGQPIGGWAQYSMSPTMAIWMAQSFDEYYLYTGDKEFLQDKAYPFFAEIGQAIEALLIERDGKLYLPLSSSPEIHDNTREAYVKPNSNYDLALMRYLYITLAGYAEILGDTSAKDHYEEILEKLDDIAIEKNLILVTDGEPLRESHRHFSHIMCLYPLHLINFDTPEHQDIYTRTITDLEKLGTGYWCGYSFAWAAALYAMALNGNGAWQNLHTFAHGFVEANGFHVNGDFKKYGYSFFHYRPFTLEGNFAYCDALHEMLMQDHMGYIRVFPAIPAEWDEEEISFRDLRSRSGVLVSAVRKGELCEVRFKSDKEQTVRLFNSFSDDTVRLTVGGRETSLKAKDGILCFTLPANETAVISK